MYRMAAATKLRELRDSLGATQEGVARRTNIGLRTYVRAEDGQRITYGTATQILEAMNGLLSEARRPKVTLEELGLNLY